ncbi:winged helix-turn-helix domain-containing protein [Streptomyces sp. NPDC057654]|uniref:winged helix-turn-helix domain-containing protein n=1 Tax=Streptomyces sp. NPDC057654 TaxID=3346196 RepID=UPI0036ACEAF7
MEGDAEAPLSSDPYEDWVRPPVPRGDLELRKAALLSRKAQESSPVLDPGGLLTFGFRSVCLTRTQAWLMDFLIGRLGEVTGREELYEHLGTRTDRPPTRNSFDLHMMRLRQRIEEVHLTLDTVWGRGYVLQSLAVSARAAAMLA